MTKEKTDLVLFARELVERLTKTTLLVPLHRQDLFGFLPPGQIGGEVGVATGGFARTIFGAAAPGKMHLVDLWETQSLEEYPEDGFNQNSEFHNRNYNTTVGFFKAELAAERVVIHRGRSVERSRDFPDIYFDWIHIDANHTYEGAYQDLMAYLPKVKPEGLIFCHDFTNNQTAEECNFGVVPAVRDFCKNTGCYPIVVTTQEDFPTVVLAKSPTASSNFHFMASLLFRLKGIVQIEDFLERNYQHIQFKFTPQRHSFMIRI